jgi:Flp pilus assembly protein CpaB
MTYRTRNIAIAVGLAVVAMLLTLVYVTSYRRSVQHAQATVQVYVAAHDIAVGTSGADLANTHAFRSITVPRHAVVPGAISNPAQVANLVVAQPLYAGDQVTVKRFSDLHAQGIRGELKGTMRAVQVSGDANQLLAGTLQTGDHIDLVANLRNDPSIQQPETKIVLRNLTVLQSSGQTAVPAATGTTASASVILAVSDTQVERLFYVLKNADWTFELRPAFGATDGPTRIESGSTVLHGGSS